MTTPILTDARTVWPEAKPVMPEWKPTPEAAEAAPEEAAAESWATDALFEYYND
ncbi:MAG: hypothetical protein ACT4QE_02010 [Anaerolineales bacterium]